MSRSRVISCPAETDLRSSHHYLCAWECGCQCAAGDAAAHRGAVNAKGKTVAVFGTGADVVYPKEHNRLTEQILALGGTLISEFPLGTFAAPQTFPIRNSDHQRSVAGRAGGGSC